MARTVAALPVVFIRTLRSARSRREDSHGRVEDGHIIGVGLQNGLSVDIDDPVLMGPAFAATNNGVQYSVSPPH
jgi:hypothetical protein